MPSAEEVKKWSTTPTKKFRKKCSTPNLPRIKMKYVRRLYNTTTGTSQASTSETEKDWDDEKEKERIVIPPTERPKGLFMECMYEKEEGICQRIAEKLTMLKDSGKDSKEVEVNLKEEAEEEEEKDWEDDEEKTEKEGTGEPSHAIIMLQYKRGRILQQVLGDISKQTTGSDVYIWNNNVNNKIRCKMMEVARSVAKESHSTIRTLWIHNSPVNIGPLGSYAMATTISSMYKQLIFVNDDCASPANMVETFIKEHKQFPKDMISTWGKFFFF